MSKPISITTSSNGPGECPYCNSKNITYVDSEPMDDSYFYEFKCDDCGKVSREWFNMVYDETRGLVDLDDEEGA